MSLPLQTNIYDSNIYFSLQFRDNTTLILQPNIYTYEPSNWNKMANDVPRDSQWYGFWSDFIEDKYGLTFTYIKGDNGLTGGAEFLQNIYETYGDQAEVYFSIGYSNNAKVPYSQIKSWRVNLQEYELIDGSDIYPLGGVMTSIEKMPFQGKLKARFSAPCTINSYTNMDGDLLTPIPTWTLRLHSKSLEEESESQTQTPQTSSAYDLTVDTVCMSHDFMMQPDQSNVIVNELYNVYTQPSGIYPSKIDDATTGTPEDPTVGGLVIISGEDTYLNSVNQYSPSTNGNLSIDWSGQFVLYTSNQGLEPSGFWFTLTPRATQWRNIGGVWTFVSVQAGTPQTISNGNSETPIAGVPVWVTGQNWSAGQLAWDLTDAGLFAAKVALTGSSTVPHSDSTHWWSITQWVLGGTFVIGDVVFNSTTMYICISGVTGVQPIPPLDTTHWKVLPTWVTGTAYGSGASVIWNGIFYQSSSSVTSSIPPPQDSVNWNMIAVLSSILTSIFPYDINGASQQYILPSLTSSTQRGASTGGLVTRYNGYIWNNTFNFVVEAGDQIFVHLVGLQANSTAFRLDSDNVSNGVQFDLFENTITYTQLTTVPSSIAPAYRAIDVLNQMVENLTGQKNAVISPFYQEGGAGYKQLFTNGYGLRNFNSLTNAPKKSLETFLGDLQGEECLYVGIRELNGVEYLVVDYITQGFKTLTIDTFLDPLDYKEKHNTRFSYNKFNFGYSTWQGLNLIMEDEFNTQAKYLTQFLKYGDNALEKLSSVIRSGYILEEQRRNQFNLNPNQSITNDNDWFGVCTSEPSIFQNITLLPNGDTDGNTWVVFAISSLAAIQGDVVSLVYGGVQYTLYILSELSGYPQIGSDAYYVSNSGDWASGSYTVSQIVYDTTASQWYICILAVSGSTRPGLDSTHWLAWTFFDPTIAITITPSSPDQIFAERNQPFSICTGVIDPTTIYNGRKSPKHILYNWAPIIAIGLYFVNPESNDWSVSRIVTTEVKMNSKFTTQFLESEEFKGNAGTLTLCEFNNENISNFVGLQLFSPIQGNCKIYGGWNQIEILRKALCGETGDATIDCGGIVLKDNKGEIWFHHIVGGMKYDLVKNWIELDTQKVFRIS